MPWPRFTARLTRDSVLFTLGVLGVIYETLVTNADRPTLLILFAACMGLPVFLRADEVKAQIMTKVADEPALNPTAAILNPDLTETVEAQVRAEILRTLAAKKAARGPRPEDTP